MVGFFFFSDSSLSQSCVCCQFSWEFICALLSLDKDNFLYIPYHPWLLFEVLCPSSGGCEMPTTLRDEFSAVHCSLHIDQWRVSVSISYCEKKLLWYLSIIENENSLGNEIRELRFRFVCSRLKTLFFLEFHSFHVEVTVRPEKPRWGCSQVDTEKAKNFHRGCGQGDLPICGTWVSQRTVPCVYQPSDSLHTWDLLHIHGFS